MRGSFVCLVLLLVQPVLANKLSLDDVLESTRNQAPKILMAAQKIVMSQEKMRSATGAFDSKLSVDYYNRESDVYPSSYYKGKIEKPLQFLNSKVYGGYKVSDGTFPTYEGKNITLDDGELMAGISVALLRNRAIDSKRLKLGLSELSLEKSQWKQKEVLMKLQKEATVAYWYWVSYGQKLEVAKGLLQLAEKRQVGFKRRIKQGDLADIYAVENQQYIVKRMTKMRKLSAQLQMAALYLSLYYRDSKGNPILVGEDKMPGLKEMESVSWQQKQFDMNKLLKDNFSLRSLQVEIASLKKRNEFLDSRFLPELRLNYEYNRDRGDGSKTLRGNDHKVYVGFNIPIERNKIKGDLAANKANMRLARHNMRLKADTLRVKLSQLSIKLAAAKDIMKNTQQEVELGMTLEKGERRKFRSGASDFFVVNIREQNTADAKEKRINALFDYQETLAKFREVLMDYKL
jgi:hypothetical protein